MEPRPSKWITYLLIAWSVAFATSATWLAVLVVFRDRNPILTDFVAMLQDQSKQLMPNSRIPIKPPILAEDELIVLLSGPYTSIPPDDIGLSKESRSAMFDDTHMEHRGAIFLYLVRRGEVHLRERVSECNLTYEGKFNLVIRPKDKAMLLACGPPNVSSREQCHRHPLWNDKCRTTLVVP